MKIIILTLIGIFLFTSFSLGITNTELEHAEDTLRQMDSKIAVLRGYVQQARAGVIEGIVLTQEQKQGLKNKYLNEKAELVNLYNQLP